MTESRICQQVDESLMTAYVGGHLPHPYAVAVAAHAEMCDDCRASMHAHWAVGGILLDGAEAAAVSAGLRDRVLEGAKTRRPPDPAPAGTLRPFPLAVMQELGFRAPRWRPLGGGIRQCMLCRGDGARARLLSIPGGRAVPEHGHRGLEMTLVLQGAFDDETGRYRAGDMQVVGSHVDHRPVAVPGDDCVCLAVTDRPLVFKDRLLRILQPVFRI